ncbi:MAG TPA: PAS domain S-box protein [Roseiarcus sp.]|jgi:two-component system sensor kinase FixL
MEGINHFEVDSGLSHAHADASVTSAGVGTWAFDPATRSFEGSLTTHSLLGFPEGQEIVFETLLSRIRDEDARRLAEALEAAADLDVQIRVLRDGQQHWLRVRGGVVGTTDRLSGVILDIDRQKTVEEALRTREEHLRSILDTVPDAMIVIDETGVIQRFSRAAERMFGYTEQEAVGRNINLLMPEPDRTRHDDYLDRYRKTGERRIIGVGRIATGKRVDGSTFPIHLSVGEMNSAGRRYFTGFLRDLTEQQRTQANLQQLQSEIAHVSRLSAMGEMASALAHELNQPLAAISNYMKGSRRLLAASPDPNAATIKTALDKASEQAIRAGQIIRRLRDFVLRRESERRIESVGRLVEEAAALGLVGAREAGVLLRLHLDSASDLVVADRVQVQQVLVNLLRNAMEAMSESARRELTVASARVFDGMVEISVSDTGPGLPDTVLAKLFQPFFTTKEAGMGVGLSISRTIIEAHGGQMRAETNPTGGATFRFTLPAAA